MENNTNPFPLRPAAEDDQPATEPSEVVQFLADLAQELAVPDPNGFLDCAADLTVRALAAAAAVGPFHGGTEVDGVFTVLGETMHTYTDTARAYLDPSFTFTASRPDLHERAAALRTAVDRLTEIVKAMEARFRHAITMHATWEPGGALEVFDYHAHPRGEFIPLDPPTTPVDTIEEATRQLAERGFVVVGGWTRHTGTIGDMEVEEYRAALRFTRTLTF
ncbi:hypothetical protein ACWDSJ_28420 [Nocardia sp. NPDC003482]